MANCNDRARRKRTRAKNLNRERSKNPILTFCLFDDVNIRETIFDSAGPYHRELMKKIGAIALLPFNAPLNGTKGTFENVLKDGSNFLLLHSEYPFEMEEKELLEFQNTILDIRRQKKKLQIFATPFVAEKMVKSFHLNQINKVNDIISKIKNSHG